MYKIYKLTHNTLGTVYVGRTTKSFKRRRNTGYRCNPELMKIIDDCEYILIENTNDKQREAYWIEKLINDGVKLLNKYKNNYDEKKYEKEYYENNKENIVKKQLDYQELNKDKLKEYRREYYRKQRKQ